MSVVGSIVTDAEALAAILRPSVQGDPEGFELRVYVDPGQAANNRPCVLVAPPRIDYTSKLNTWRLIALAGSGSGTYAALAELDELVQGVGRRRLPIESADPGSYVLVPEQGSIPCYVLNLTT